MTIHVTTNAISKANIAIFIYFTFKWYSA